MGVKLLAESSAPSSEMLVMDFDGCGCVLACEVVDGVGDKQFVEVAECAHNKGSLCARTLEGADQSSRTTRRIQSEIITLFVLGTCALRFEFTSCEL